MKVFIIVEECHGSIGVATSPKSAMRWLIEEGWIGEWSEYGVYIPGETNPIFGHWEHCSVQEYCEQNGIADWQQWLIDNASVEFLEDHFLIYLREHDLAENE
jgi:hypothetical protein